MLKDLIIASRSYRSFDRSVRPTRQALAEMVEHARLCPCAMNLQVCKFRLVTAEEEILSLASATRWAARLQDRKLPPIGHEPTAFVVICLDETLGQDSPAHQKDVGIYAQSILLSAAEQGLGGCMLASFEPARLCEILALPAHLSPQLVLAIGRPDETVCLVEPTDGDVGYYREGDTHCVPKRPLEELII